MKLPYNLVFKRSSGLGAYYVNVIGTCLLLVFGLVFKRNSN